MNRREFTAAIFGAAGCLGMGAKAWARAVSDPLAGKPWKGWKPGEFQVHFIYTGVAESMFYIYPDGTTMLLDCGDHAAHARGKLAVPILPDMTRHAGEWISRYVLRVNPRKDDVDYAFLSHFHRDHGGGEPYSVRKEKRDGRDYWVSGFGQAADFLKFHIGCDRGYPDYNVHQAADDYDGHMAAHMKSVWNHLKAKGGFRMEKFRVGARNQFGMLRDSAKYPFSVLNVCGNGVILQRDGTVRDLYCGIPRERHVNENGMSLGMIFQYGPFRFFTAGDFSDRLRYTKGGAIVDIEEEFGPNLDRCDVCKINHHGHYSMPENFIRGVRSRVYVACIWDQLHVVDPVMARLADKKIYPGERLLAPGIMPAERRATDSGKPWMNDVAPETYEGAHIVLNVAEGGEKYDVAFLVASDESMTVRGVYHFTSGV